MSFEPNLGQTHAEVQYLVRGGSQTLFFTRNYAVVSMLAPANAPPAGKLKSVRDLKARQTGGAAIRMNFRGSRQASSIEPLEPLPGKVNYFIGNDSSKWRTNIPTYGRVAYRSVYPGVDLMYYGTQGSLEYDFVAKPGADTNAIQVQFEGAKGIRLSEEGDLVLDSAAGPLRWKKPYVYQEDHGVRRQVAASYRLLKDSAVGFQLARYDRKLPVVIDPVLVYSTYIGGSGADLGPNTVIDSTGIYVASITYSFDFPTTPGAWDRTLGGTYDVYAAKLNPAGTAMLYSTYLGGSDNDGLNPSFVLNDGSVLLAGFTASSNFPVTPGAVQAAYGGDPEDGFITHLSAAGDRLISSTYLGGFDDDDIYSMDIDNNGNIYVCGETATLSFPVTVGALQTVYGGGLNDGFITKLNPTTTTILYSTFLGGSGDESLENPDLGQTPPQIRFSFGNSIHVDSTGAIYVIGVTTSNDFPTTPGAYSRTNQGGGGDGYVAKINPAGNALVYSTFLGGPGFDAVESIFVDSSGTVLVAGVTGSTTFPTTPGAFQRVYKGGAEDGFAARLDSTGSTLLYSTLFGGSEQEAFVVADVSSNGNILLSGLTYSSNIPVTPGTYQTTYGGAGDVFISVFDSTLSSLIDSTYLGTSSLEIGSAGFAPGPNDILVSGRTDSLSFPLTPLTFQNHNGGGSSPHTDGFISRFTLSTSCTYSISPSSAAPASNAGTGTVSVTAGTGCPWGAGANVPWLSITSGSPGTGSGTVGYSVQANTGAARTGTLTIAGKTFTVNQSASTTFFSINPTSANVTGSGGTGSVSVTATPATATWTAVSNSSFLTITSGASGTGNGTVNYSVAANTSISPRTGTATIAGQTFTVNQAGATPTFTISPTSSNIGALGGGGAVAITASSPDAPWTATSNSNFIAITSLASGVGNGFITYNVLSNATNAPRSGTLTIAGQTFTLTQNAAGTCSFVVTPPSAQVPSGAGNTASLTGSFSVIASGCSASDTWTAVSNSPRLVITSGGSGNGSQPFATVNWSMFTNSTTQTRTAQINVAGQAFIVSQAGTTETQGQRVVRALYQTILGREPDAGGFAFWTGTGAPRDPVTGAVLYNQMADGFYTSPEFKNSGWLVLNIYQALTGNLPNFANWLAAVTQIRQGTLTAAQLTNSLAGAVSNTTFVQNAYQNAFNRQPNATELANGVAALNNGQTKIDFLNTVIFTSTEFTTRTNGMLVQALFYTILVRDPDAGGFAFWLAQLNPPNGQPGIYYLYNPQPVTPAYTFKLAVIGQAVPPNPNLLGFLGSPEFQGLIQ